MPINYCSGIVFSFLPFALHEIISGSSSKKKVVICRNQEEAKRLKEQLQLLFQEHDIIHFPEWDCLPYDRVSPSLDVMSERTQALLKLNSTNAPYILITSLSGAMQRVMPPDALAGRILNIQKGKEVFFDILLTFLSDKGFHRRECVYDIGDYAVRGSIVDVFSLGSDSPIRIDFFGDEVETIRQFDVETQKTISNLDMASIQALGELILDKENIITFQQAYREMYINQTSQVHKDPLFTSISNSIPFSGMEHWLPLFFTQKLSTLFDYTKNADILLTFEPSDASAHLAEIHNYFKARQNPIYDGDIYRPLQPEALYLTLLEWDETLEKCPQTYSLSFFDRPNARAFNSGPGINISQLKPKSEIEFHQALKDFIQNKELIIFTANTEHTFERIKLFLEELNIHPNEINAWPFAKTKGLYIIQYPLEHGFVSSKTAVITDQDLFGEKLNRTVKARRNPDKFFQDLSAFNMHDVIVHRSHGFGRYEGLETLDVNGVRHDCLRIIYTDNDKLYLPVENIDLISRYGGDHTLVQLDRLGSSAWDNRKNRAKKRIAVVADYLIRMAAERSLHEGEAFTVPHEILSRFNDGFPYNETEDQLNAIEDTLDDLASGKPMDRLVCGDVGFGKTEIALRAAFVAAQNGKQVALVTPTSLLCRQHYITFSKRFEAFGIHVEQLSRMVNQRQRDKIKQSLESDEIKIVVGTHSLLDDGIKFKDLGLVIVDEEQHFGVKQKEKLKNLKANVHVLTLTATPIPRTLQMSLAGVRDLSLITTPPVDRLAVRTFVMPFDGLTIREAILREYQRGGQVFYVTPRLEDIDSLLETLQKLVPEVRVAVAHGQMTSSDLEDAITQFYDRRYDVLLSTNIIESGIDIPTANTLIIHRCDLFGLSQLYQLRGRVGRSKVQGYAYFTYEADKTLTSNAQQRLEVMQRLDTLGSGFSLASYDMDIRGAGNIVGEEQSGHIREVGVELYQNLLQEAIIMARAGQANSLEHADDHEWSPQINVGTAVLIPDTYISDLGLRLNFYRRIGNVDSMEESTELQEEMIDRFGKLPHEVRNLFEVISLKILCRKAGIDRLDAGPKGLVIGFFKNTFHEPNKLLALLQSPKVTVGGFVKIRPDQRIAFVREWGSVESRLKGVKHIIALIATL